MAAVFARQVARTPAALAVVDGTRALTYRELDRRATAVACGLRTAGVVPEDLVALTTARSIGRLTALVGIVKAGAAYMPLDRSLPTDRLTRLFERAVPALWLHDDDPVAASANAATIRRIPAHTVEELTATPPTPGARFERRSCAPAQRLYVNFTSGSSGAPKGVEIPHRAVLRLVAKPGFLALGPGHTLLHHSPIAFDASTFEIWGALLTGACCALVPAGRATPAAIAETIRRHDVDIAWLTASLFNLVVDEYPETLAGLRHVIAGGEQLSTEHVRRARSHHPGLCVLNGYGPTEATTFATTHRVDDTDLDGSRIPIGSPLPGTDCHVLDATGTPVEAGELGDLFIGGTGLARGYLGDPAATAAAFVPDPFSTRPGARMYGTGDRVRRRADGQFVFHGRDDRQLKIRGHRVEPAEIEYCLREHAQIGDAAVVDTMDGVGECVLAAFLTPSNERGPRLNGEDVRAYLADRLPPHLVPDLFEILVTLPRSANGKLNRGLLRASLATAAGTTGTRPRRESSATLALVLGIWRRLLQRDVAANDGLREHGVHSLLLTRFAARAADELDCQVPLGDLFGCQTPMDIARRLDDAAATGLAWPAWPEATANREHPLSAAQERILFLGQLSPDSLAYNTQAIFRLAGCLDRPALERALAGIVQRHEIFRTTFHAGDPRPVQRVHTEGIVALPLCDLSTLPTDERGARCAREIGRIVEQRFDTTELPLVRWDLIRLAPEEHLLVQVEHHLVHDGWSLNRLSFELGALYDDLVNGRESRLPRPRAQFAEFCRWQEAWAGSGAAAQQLTYWREAIDVSVPPLDLPGDFRRPAESRHRGAALRRRLPEGVANGLRQRGRQGEGTLFALMLAAWQSLLFRLSGQGDFHVGTTLANRRHSRAEGVLGMCVNTVAIRASLEADATFDAVVDDVAARMRAAHDNQELPFERLVEAVAPRRESGRNPIFQVMFGFHDSPAPTTPMGPLEVTVEEAVANGSAKFDLSLIVVPRLEQRLAAGGRGNDESIEVVWEYDTDLYRAATVEAFADSYEALLQALAGGFAGSVGELPLAAPTLAAESDGPGSDEPQRGPRTGGTVGDPSPSIEAVIAEHSESRPHALAVTGCGESLTYEQLEHAVERLRGRLLVAAAGPETVVAVILQRSVALVVTQLAILECGATYLPIDASLPHRRIKQLLVSAGAGLAVAASEHESLMAECGIPVLDPGAKTPERAATSALETFHPASAAYLLFTSGSSGTPKGVVIPRAAIAHHMAWMLRDLPLGPADRVLQKTPVGFDASVWEFWAPLMCGARLVLAPPGAERRPEELVAVVGAERITVLQVVPSLLELLLDVPDFARCSDLHRVVCGGEAMSPELRERFRQQGPPAQLLNVYGPTEATIHASFADVTCAADGRVPIGKAIANTRLYVLDSDLRPLPGGAAGELFVSGPGVGRGYHDQPAATAARFLPDPFAPGGASGTRMYRTGDRVRQRVDGGLEYLGRLDDQIKIGGVRIEPGEIEAHLQEHPAVRRAVVRVRGKAEETRLHAWITATDSSLSGQTLQSELRSHLRERLPATLVPATVTCLEQIPTTANGKTDYRALPAPVPAAAGCGDAPVGPEEQAVAELWCQLLEAETVSRDGNFFDLGGHSLLAMRMVARCRARYGLELSLQRLYAGASLAELVAAAGRGGERLEQRPALAPTLYMPRPLLPVEAAIWFAAELDPNGSAYNVAAAYRLFGDLQPRLLDTAFQRLVERHPYLRARVVDADSGPSFEPVAAPRLEHVDLRATLEPTRELDAQLAERVHEPFDLRKGPGLRAVLWRLAEQEHVLLHLQHHLITDAAAQRRFELDWSAAYAALLGGQAANLAPPASLVASSRPEAGGLRYWRDALDGAVATALPPDRHRIRPRRFRGATWKLRLSESELPGLAARGGAAPYLGAFATLLGRKCGRDDLLLGVVASCRRTAESRELGCRIHMLPLRLSLRADGMEALTRRVRGALGGALEHADAWEQVRGGGHRLPELRAVFAHRQEVDRDGLRLGDVAIEPLEVRRGTAQFDLSLTVIEHTRGAVLEFEYDTDLYRPETIEAFAADLAVLLAARSVDASAMSERARGARPAVIAHAPDRHDPSRLVAEFAARSPDASAIAARGDRPACSYAQLEGMIAARAAQLLDAGVEPGGRVLLRAERARRHLVDVLACMRAGAVVVPVEGDAPQAWLAAVATRTGARWLPADDSIVGRGETAATSARRKDRPLPPDAEAYVLHTSGSTGAPKGVAISRAALIGYARAAAGRYGLRSDDRVLLAAAPAFDLWFEEVFAGFAVGACLVPVAEHVTGSAPTFMEFLGRQSVTVASLPTGYWQQLACAADRGTIASASCLRLMIVGGERLTARAAAAWYEAGGCSLTNTYGPTEATIVATEQPVEAATVHQGEGADPAIGKPLAGVECSVLGADLRPVVTGSVGELFLRGERLALGYVGQGAATAARFRPDPFGPPGTRMYATGDQVRLDPGGTLWFEGRADDQLKVDTHRVEPAAVANTLEQHPEVLQAAVVGVPSTEHESIELAALVVRSHGANGAPAAGCARELRDYLSRSLPAAMVPRTIRFTERLPLTERGKIDRDAIVARLRHPASERERRPGSTAARVQAIWTAIFPLEAEPAVDFFASGGNSLLAIRLLSRLRAEFGVELALPRLLQDSSLAGISRSVEQLARRRLAAAPAECIVPLRHEGSQPPLFCIHPVGGNVVEYRDLVRRLRSDQPVYGVAAPALTSGSEVSRDLEQIAQTYLRGVRVVQPHGPYRLLGWSMGGLVAFEMARQLTADGDGIQMLAVIDVPAPGSSLLAEISHTWETFARSLGLRFADGDLDGFDTEAAAARVLEAARRAGVIAAATGASDFRQMYRTFARHSEAIQRYAPEGRLAVHADVFRARDDARSTHPTLEWDRWIDHLEIHDLPGDHCTVVREPNVAALARILERRLEAIAPQPSVALPDEAWSGP